MPIAEDLMAIPAGVKLLRNLNLSNAYVQITHPVSHNYFIPIRIHINIPDYIWGGLGMLLFFRIMDGVLSNQLVYIGDILISEKDEISTYRCYEELLRSRVSAKKGQKVNITYHHNMKFNKRI